MDYLLGASLGILIAFVLAIPALVIETFDRKHKRNLPLLVDVKEIWGRKITHPEMFVIALLVHLVVGGLFGAIYPLAVLNNWLYITGTPYTFISLFWYALHVWLMVMLMAFPIIGFGFFGKKEGKLVWLELLITMILIGICLQFVIEWFRPFFFVI
ncbi:MAG: hypothetical protein ABIH67_00405 [Candidatus Uhrbacteria bacterium]